MQDRFMNGFIAGLIGNIPAIILDVIAGIINLDKIDYTHFVSILLFDDRILSVWEYVFSLSIQFSFAGILGVLFTYFIIAVKEKYYYIKAVIFGGIIVWFSIYAIDIVFSIHEKAKIDFSTSIVHFFIALIWAVVMAWTFAWLEKREIL